MSAQNDGGPAFPQFFQDAWKEPRVAGGMTLRDYLAAKALSALSVADFDGLTRLSNEAGVTVTEFVARQAYAVADAMLKAREVKPS